MKEKTRIERIKKNWKTQIESYKPIKGNTEIAEIIDFLGKQSDAFYLDYGRNNGLYMVIAIQGRHIREWNQTHK